MKLQLPKLNCKCKKKSNLDLCGEGQKSLSAHILLVLSAVNMIQNPENIREQNIVNRTF